MCVAEFHEPRKGVGRRKLVKLGAMTVATAALAGQLGTRAAHAEAHGAPARAVNIDNIVDLTHVLSRSTPIWPGSPTIAMIPMATHEKDGYFGNQLVVMEHHGTHLDAPLHFAKGGWSTDQLPASALVAPAVVIDIRPKAAGSPDAAVTMDEIRAWESAHGRIPDGAAVLLNSGWAARINDQDAFRNTGPDKMMHFPGFDKEVAQFLLAERSIVGVGVDTLSADLGNSQTFDVHNTLLPANKWVLEAVANLENIPPAGAHIFVGVPKHAGGSGGPARVIAAW